MYSDESMLREEREKGEGKVSGKGGREKELEGRERQRTGALLPEGERKRRLSQNRVEESRGREGAHFGSHD